MFEVAIIGASVAGSALAINLGRLGIKTIILDKMKFPRRKACGEGLAKESIEQLLSLGISKDFLLTNGISYQSYIIDNEFNFPQSSTGNIGKGFSRTILDNKLNQELLRYKSISPVYGIGVTGIERKGDYFQIISKSGIIHSRFVVFADGINSLAYKLNFTKRLKNPSSRFALSSVWQARENVFSNKVQIFNFANMEIFLTQTDPDVVNVSVIGKQKEISSLSREVEFLKEFVEKKYKTNLMLADKILGCGPLGGISQNSAINEAILIGDAAESLDPAGGMGIYHGLYSAKLAASCLEEIILNNSESAIAFLNYQNQRERFAESLRGFSDICRLFIEKSSHNLLIKSFAKYGGAKIIEGVFKQRVSSAINPSTVFLRTAGVISKQLHRVEV